MSVRQGCSCCGDCGELSATHQEKRPHGPTISSFPYEGMWELWTDHQARRLHGSVRPGGGGLTKATLMWRRWEERPGSPFERQPSPEFSFTLIPGSPMPEAMALNAGATEALGPHASHWPGLLFVSPAPLRWQLTEASLALRGERFKEEGRIREPRSPCMTRQHCPHSQGGSGMTIHCSSTEVNDSQRPRGPEHYQLLRLMGSWGPTVLEFP